MLGGVRKLVWVFKSSIVGSNVLVAMLVGMFLGFCIMGLCFGSLADLVASGMPSKGTPCS